MEALYNYPGLAATFAIFGVVVWLLAGRHFSPSVALFGMWGGSLLLIALGMHLSDAYEPPSLVAGAFLFNVGLAAVLGTAVGEVFWQLLRGPRISGPVSPVRPLGYKITYLKLFSFAATILTLANLLSLHISVHDYLTLGSEIRGKLTDDSGSGTSPISAAASCCLMIVLPPIIARTICLQRFAWWMLLPIISIVLMSLVSIGKFTIIFLGLYGLNVALYNRARKDSVRLKKRVVLLIALTLMGSFWVTSVLRGSLEKNGDPRSDALGQVIYAYATGYIPAFCAYYDERTVGDVTTRPTNADFSETDHRIGNQTFAGLYRLMAYAGLVKNSATNHYEGNFNVYTILRDFLMDFGNRGTFCLVCLLSAMVQVIFRLGRLSDSRWIVFIALITVQMEFSLVYSLFGLIFYPIALFLAPLLGRASGRRTPATAPAIP